VRQTLPGGTDNPEALDRCLRELVRKVTRELQQRHDACGRVSLRVTTEEGHPAQSVTGKQVAKLRDWQPFSLTNPRTGALARRKMVPVPDFATPSPVTNFSLRLRNPSREEGDLLRACRVMLRRLSLPAPISAIALKVSECRRDSGRQLSLFHDNRALTRKRRRTSKALEVIRECFGNDIAILGAEIELPRRERVLAVGNW